MLVFLHMTKTAGGSLKTALQDNDRIVFGNYSLKQDSFNVEGGDILFGHSMYGIHEKLGCDPRYAIFLREPVTRVISHYYQLRDVDIGPQGEKIRKFTNI